MKIKVLILPVGQLQTNCYVMEDEETREGWIIDPGDDGDYIARVLAEKEIKPVKILATHGHFDHIMAALELQLNYQIPFLVHEKDEFLVSSLQKRAKHWLGYESPPPPKIDEYLKGEQKLSIGGVKFEVVETPGHSPGSVALYSPSERIVFVGDLMFAGGGVGRTDFSYASEEDLYKSIKKILGLPSKTVIYSGHGKVASVEAERKFY